MTGSSSSRPNLHEISRLQTRQNIAILLMIG